MTPSKWGNFASILGLVAFCCFAASFAEAPVWARLAIVGAFFALWKHDASRRSEAKPPSIQSEPDNPYAWTDSDDFVELWYAADERAKQKLRDRWRNQGLGMLANDPRIMKELVGQSKKI